MFMFLLFLSGSDVMNPRGGGEGREHLVCAKVWFRSIAAAEQESGCATVVAVQNHLLRGVSAGK